MKGRIVIDSHSVQLVSEYQGIKSVVRRGPPLRLISFLCPFCVHGLNAPLLSWKRFVVCVRLCLGTKSKFHIPGQQ